MLAPGSRLDHVGIASPSAAHPAALLLGAASSGPRAMRSGVVVERYGQIEVVAPGRPGNPIERFLERRGSGLHHVAIAVPQPLVEVRRQLAERGIEATGEIEPGSDGRNTLFLHPSTLGGVLVELVEDV
jgi:methylmalonyl-CoA/ethylmalonyl-CoA epimerase